MVRGNWQKRVETAEARRTAAKQRKQRRDNRGVYKSQVLDLFASLDSTKIHPNHTIHVWVDSAPQDSPPILDMHESNSSAKGGRGGGKKGRGRSNSINEEKKKAHPRSKDNAEPEEEDTVNVPRLCRKHFYCGRCDDIGKKGGCRHVHLPVTFKTLSQVVNDKSSKADTKEVLSLSESAASVQSDDDAGVEMVYYLSINVNDTFSSDESSLSISEVVSRKLGDEACGVASIVYLAVDNYLLFDRYRGGVVVSDGDIQAVLYGGDRRTRRSSSVFSDEGGDENDDHQEYYSVHLPAHLLEYILMFLPDNAVSSMALVCQHWHHEIGQHSPDLWRRLLERREWPMPNDNATGESPRDVFRTSFLNHYTVVRDIEAVALAIGAISAGASRKLIEEKEAVCEVFSARRLAPQEPNGCIGVRNWSSGQVLAAYSNDCTLRLFKTVAKCADGSSSSPRACRELVCVSVDPFRNTKRQTCRLVAMDLDEEVIGCLCQVIGDDYDHEAYILAVTRRDDFLAASGSKHQSPGGASLEEGKVHIIDIGEAVLNYLISYEEVDHRLLRLFDYLSDGGDSSEVEIIVSQSIKACGYGRFLVEVAISIPSTPLEEEEVNEVMILLDRKLMLFSASAEAIVWTGETNPTDGDLLPRHTDVTIASFQQVQSGERRATCSLAFVSSASHKILCTELDSSGQMRCPQVVEASGFVRNEILENGWQMQNTHRRPVVITPSDIVTVDSLFRHVEGRNKVSKTVVSFYPRFVEGISYATLALDGDCQAVRMESTHKDYVVVLCRFHKSGTRTLEDDRDLIDGHWFGVDAAAADESITTTTIEAVIIHVPSRKVIHQVFLVEEDAAAQPQINYDIPIFFTPIGSGRGTIGVGLSWKGLAMTGRDVRDVGLDALHLGEEDAPRSCRKQKKKKRQPNRGGKKDGFARGMSLRG